MPERERAKLEKPETSYMFGWSHGKEIMNGVNTMEIQIVYPCSSSL